MPFDLIESDPPIAESCDMDQDVRNALKSTHESVGRMAGSISTLVSALTAPQSASNPTAKSGVAANLEKPVAVIAGIVVIIGAIVGAVVEFSNLDKHISRVETAVRIVGAKQGADTQTLNDEALKVAVANVKTDPNGAKAVVAIANRWIAQQGESRIPAPQESFTSALSKYQVLAMVPALSGTAHDGILKLAEYSAAVAPPPPQHLMVFAASLEVINGHYFLHDGVLIGPRALATSSEGTDIDNFTISNVVFKDVVIIYHGGPLTLSNVRFINCRFVVTNSSLGNQLLAAAIQQPANATIG